VKGNLTLQKLLRYKTSITKFGHFDHRFFETRQCCRARSSWARGISGTAQRVAATHSCRRSTPSKVRMKVPRPSGFCVLKCTQVSSSVLVTRDSIPTDEREWTLESRPTNTGVWCALCLVVLRPVLSSRR
jgi:hypothetical protein